MISHLETPGHYRSLVIMPYSQRTATLPTSKTMSFCADPQDLLPCVPAPSTPPSRPSSNPRNRPTRFRDPLGGPRVQVRFALRRPLGAPGRLLDLLGLCRGLGRRPRTVGCPRNGSEKNKASPKHPSTKGPTQRCWGSARTMTHKS